MHNKRTIFTSSRLNQPINLSIYKDYSKNKSILNRINGIYKVYDQLFLNEGYTVNTYDINENNIDKFTFKLTHISPKKKIYFFFWQEDLHDNINNISTAFNLYFIIKPDFNKTIKFDIKNLNKHFAKYPLELIDNNIVKFYKNTGLIAVNGILVFSLLMILII